MSQRKVAVVTGGNKGIGYAIVKGLCEKFSGDVYLTARDESRGLEAVKSLNKLGLHPKFHILDITDNDTIIKLRDHIQQEYGGLDLLVNNAAIAFKVNSTEPFSIQAKESVRVNYFALKSVCEILFPLLRSHARVVNLSSSAGHLSRIPGEEIRKKLSSETLTEPELSQLMNSFVEAAEKNLHQEQGWGNSAYAVSKVGVTALTILQQKEFSNDKSREDIIVNAVHPGFVKTDMSSHKGPMSIEEGAEAPLYAALLPENVGEPKGAYIWSDKRIIDWFKELL